MVRIAAVAGCLVSPAHAALSTLQGRPSARSVIAIQARRLVSVRDGAVMPDAVVLVRGDTIAAVGRAGEVAIPEGAEVVDLGDATLLPGLIDAHVHLRLGGAPDSNARATLLAGFTTVQDLGALGYANIALRESAAAGRLDGPRILTSGPWLGVSNGTCDFQGIGVRGVEAFARRVREDVARGADVIKVCVTAWVRDGFERPDSYEVADAELEAAIAEAHRLNRKVMAHAIGAAGVAAAVRLGADAMAHAGFADSVTIESMKRRRVYLIPTLHSFSRDTATAHGRALFAHMRRVFAWGVPVAFGTDAGVIRHGRNAREFGHLVRLGLTPLQALQSATVNAAELLGLSGRLGVVAPGQAADLIATTDNPLDDITALERVVFVMKGGRVYRRETAGDQSLPVR